MSKRPTSPLIGGFTLLTALPVLAIMLLVGVSAVFMEMYRQQHDTTLRVRENGQWAVYQLDRAARRLDHMMVMLLHEIEFNHDVSSAAADAGLAYDLLYSNKNLFKAQEIRRAIETDHLYQGAEIIGIVDEVSSQIEALMPFFDGIAAFPLVLEEVSRAGEASRKITYATHRALMTLVSSRAERLDRDRDRVFLSYKILASLGAGLIATMAGMVLLSSRRERQMAATTTALTQSEIELGRKNTILNATLENISQGIVMVDEDGRMPVINRRTLEIMGIPEGLISPDSKFRDVQEWQRTNQEFLLGMPPENASGESYRRQRPNGRTIEVNTKALADGRIVRTYSDVTDLVAARERAEEAMLAQSAFLSTMSHEMRTPLNGIIGMAALFASNGLTSEQKAQISTIRSCGKALVALIDNVLDLSMIRAGRLQLERTALSVSQIVEDVLRIVSPDVEKKGLVVSLDVGVEVPDWIIGDPTRLRQVLLNLVGNAVKFTDRGAIQVRVTGRQLLGTQELRIEIKDTGIGIPREAQASLFQDFSQVDGTIRRRFGGSGLGLAISKRIMDALGGNIGYEGHEGCGSTFWCSFPTETVERPRQTGHKFQLAQADFSGEPFPTPELQSAARVTKSLQILVAEDNAVNREVALGMLERLGHTVTLAANGLEAVTVLSARPFDAIFMDMQMPELDGLAATRVIRSLPGHEGRIPIIAMTASAFQSDRDACAAAGMNGFISKPIMPQMVEDALWDVFPVDRSASSGSANPLPIRDSPTTDAKSMTSGTHAATARLPMLSRELGPDRVRLILNDFTIQAHVNVNDADKALEEVAEESFRRSIHNLKGAAANLGLLRCVELCSDAEALDFEQNECLSDILAELLRAVVEETEEQIHALERVVHEV